MVTRATFSLAALHPTVVCAVQVVHQGAALRDTRPQELLIIGGTLPAMGFNSNRFKIGPGRMLCPKCHGYPPPVGVNGRHVPQSVRHATEIGMSGGIRPSGRLHTR